MKAAVEKDGKLVQDERNLLSVAYKNVVGSKRFVDKIHTCIWLYVHLKKTIMVGPDKPATPEQLLRAC